MDGNPVVFAVQAAVVAIHAMPEQFGESIEDVDGQGRGSSMGTSTVGLLESLDYVLCFHPSIARRRSANNSIILR